MARYQPILSWRKQNRKIAISFGVKLMLDGGTIKGVAAMAPKVAPVVTMLAPAILGTAIFDLTGWLYYKAGEYFANMVNDLNGMFNSKNFWANLGGFNYDGSDW